MIAEAKKEIPLREGLFTSRISSDGRFHLVGTRCPSCGEVNFPRRKICPNCHRRDPEEIPLSRYGKIYSVTVVTQRPPIYYKGPVPYAMGFVELPEGVRVQALFTGCDPDSLEIGMNVELVIEKLFEDQEGHDVITYKFRPVDI